MKQLVTVNDIKSLASQNQKVLYLEENSLVTPAARDAAKEWGIELKAGPAPAEVTQNCCAPAEIAPCDTATSNNIDADLISRIVMDVLANLPQYSSPQEVVEEVDPSGLSLVRGNSVICDPYYTGKPGDKVGLKEVLSSENGCMAAGLMTVDRSTFSRQVTCDQIGYILDGTLNMVVNGNTYRGSSGDIFYIPRDTKITFSAPNKAKLFYVTQPA